jgi:ABC-type amino acid transport substrate-binding protein
VPYAYADEKGVLTGADAVIARMVVQKMGIKEMDGVLTEFASLIPGLKASRFDIVLAMFVNPQRCAQVAFSEPIYRVGQGIIVRSGNPKKIRNYGDLIKQKDVKIAVMAGAVQTNILKKLGVPESRIVSFPDGPSAIAAVSAGRADVFTISDLPARRLLAAAGSSTQLEPRIRAARRRWAPGAGTRCVRLSTGGYRVARRVQQGARGSDGNAGVPRSDGAIRHYPRQLAGYEDRGPLQVNAVRGK